MLAKILQCLRHAWFSILTAAWPGTRPWVGAVTRDDYDREYWVPLPEGSAVEFDDMVIFELPWGSYQVPVWVIEDSRILKHLPGWRSAYQEILRMLDAGPGDLASPVAVSL